MRIIKPSWQIINEPCWDDLIISLERTIRTCYKSEKGIDSGTADRLIRSIIVRGHESTLEHASMSVRFVCDRGVSHELVRHRHCSFSQESTRYVNYCSDSENNSDGIQFILPPWVDPRLEGTWINGGFTKLPLDFIRGIPPDINWATSCYALEGVYNGLVKDGWKPEQARSVLPNSLKTEIVVTTNIRDWRHIFKLRCDKTAHPQMRELMRPLYEYVCDECPTLFDSVVFDE